MSVVFFDSLRKMCYNKAVILLNEKSMALYETLGADLIVSMKAGDVLRRDTLRLFQSALKNVAIDKRKDPKAFTDDEVIDVIRRLVKQRKDSIEQYRTGGREDLALKEEAELNILSAYLPQAMAEEELHTLVQSVLAEAGITAKAQMGQAMGLVMKQVGKNASGDDVKRVVDSLLA
ncbi:MAG: glutamyl-tRNA amidotransferase [Candidatus Moranbacteria bacterium CG_4_8_14_3_um_filter_41_13]|nr:MAG: glutamyl-tRNA amidotransferase [Candidatus Moranbacteria bacterium CG_4_8_14_3_um_filter_41_13]